MMHRDGELSARLIDFVGRLRLVGGDHDGAEFEVLRWQRQFLHGVFRQPGDAALSVGRGNGKSCLVAGLACCVVDPAGPLHGNRREVVVVASSFTQSKIIFEDVVAFLGARHDLGDRELWRRQDSQNIATLEFRPTGARIRCLGSDPRRAHGIRPALALLDEPAQWPPTTSARMLAAVRTSLGKVPASRLVALGTRPASEGHWFARLLESAPYSQCHAARPGDPPFQRRTWKRANPSLDHLPSLREQISAERVDARRDPDALAAFKSLRLNMGLSDTSRSVLVDADTWAALPAPVGECRDGYVLGLDLGQSAAMSAAAAYFPDGRLEACAVFPEVPGLAERGLGDGVANLYVRMAERGELVQAGRRVSDIGALLAEVFPPPAQHL